MLQKLYFYITHSTWVLLFIYFLLNSTQQQHKHTYLYSSFGFQSLINPKLLFFFFLLLPQILPNKMKQKRDFRERKWGEDEENEGNHLPPFDFPLICLKNNACGCVYLFHREWNREETRGRVGNVERENVRGVRKREKKRENKRYGEEKKEK